MSSRFFHFLSVTVGLCALVFAPAASAQSLVGTLPGSVSVDNKGSANYSIPLSIAPGRGGLQPALSLNYSSGGGNGPLGVGWSVSTGFPQEITRGRSIFARDGYVSGVAYNSYGRLYLDGRRLINITYSAADDYWKVGSVYRTEVDSFVKITALGANGATTGDAIESFKLESKDGTISYFGNFDGESADALRGFYGYGNRYYSWKLKRIIDTIGNSVEFRYNVYQNEKFNYITNTVGRLSGEHLLAGIDYTANSAAGVSASFGVRLTYTPGETFPLTGEIRPDLYKDFVGPPENELIRRLVKIESGPLSAGVVDPVVRYDFSYETSPVSGLSRLNNVTFSSKADASATWKAAPPSPFTYNDDGSDGPFVDPQVSTTSPTVAIALTNPYYSLQVATGDFNGDGRTDKFLNGKVYLGTGTGFDDGNNFGTITGNGYAVRGGDIDGDGLSDLFLFSASNVYVARSNGTGFVGNDSYLGCEFGSATLDAFAFSSYTTAGASRFSVGDFNGDGRTDVLIHQGQNYSGALPGLYVALSDGVTLSSPTRWCGVGQLDKFNSYVSGDPWEWIGRAFNVTQIEPIVADFDGDGIDDYAYIERFFNITPNGTSVVYETTLRAACSRPTATGLSRMDEKTIQWQNKYVSNINYQLSDSPVMKVWVGDCNGDGLKDLLVLGENPALKFILFKNIGGAFDFGTEDYMPLVDPTTCSSNYNIVYGDSANYFYAGQYVQSGGMFLQDINHDGHPDFIIGQGEAGGWQVKYGRIDGFGPNQQLWSYDQGDLGMLPVPYVDMFGEGGISMEPIDIDGDGGTDWLLSSPGFYHVIAKGRNAKADNLIEVSNGLGAKTQIAYKSTGDSSIYTPGAPVSYPIREVRNPQIVVSDVWHDSGTGAAGDRAQFSYQYSGNRVDLSGRGGLGFHSFVTLDRQTNLFKYQFLAQSFPMTGLTHREQTFRYWESGSAPSVSTKFRTISSHDNTVVFDEVMNGATPYGTVYPFISSAIESRWEDSATAHFSYTKSNQAGGPESKAESIFPDYGASKPAGAHITISAQSTFDNQTSPQLTIPGGTFNPSDTAASGANTVAGVTSYTSITSLGLPRKITYGNLKKLSTDYGDGFTETVETTYLAPVGSLTGLVDTVSTSVASTAYGTETAPAKSYTYEGDTPLVKTETIDATGDALDLKTTYTRDALGRVTDTTIANTTATGAQAIGTYSVSSVTAFDAKWDAPTSSQNADPYRHTTTTAYHAFLGKPTSVSDVNGAQVTTVYDALGRVIQQNDILKGLTTDQAFEWTTSAATDWKKSQTVAVPSDIVGLPGVELTSVYAVRTTATVAPTTTAYYDRLGRVIRTIKNGFNGQLTVTDTVYNKLGQTVATSLPYLDGTAAASIPWTRTTYDPLGRVVTVTAPNGTVTTNTYAGRTTTVTVTPSAGNGTAQTNATLVDAKGRTVSVWNTDNIGGTTPSIAFALDGFGRMRTTTLKDQTQTITATYDALGRQITLNDPDKGNWAYLNNALGQVVTQTDARLNVTTSIFDRLGRPVTRSTTGNGMSETADFYYYDTSTVTTGTQHTVAKGEKGWIGAPEREEASSSYATATTNLHYYDAKGRPSLELARTDGKWFYTYTDYREPDGNDYSRVHQVRHYWKPSGAEAPGTQPYLWQDFGYTYNYDAKSYLLSLTDSLGRSWWDTPSYDYMDRVTSVRKGASLTTTRTYRDTDGVLTAINTGSVQAMSFNFDGLGNLTSRADTGVSETYGYDNLNRLTKRGVGAGAQATIAAYQANGNIDSKTEVGGTTVAITAYDNDRPHAVKEYTFNGQTFTIGYDANGNLLTRTGGSTTWNMKWAGFDKPRWMAKTTGTTTVGSEFHYNAARSRVMQLEFDAMNGAGPTHYNRKRLYALGSTLELNYDNQIATGTGQDWKLKKVRIYVPGPDGLIGAREFDVTSGTNGTEKALVYHYDHLGSITATTLHTTGAIASDTEGKPGKFSEDAWGQRRNPSSWIGAPTSTDDGGADSVTPRGYTGHEMLDDLGLVHMNGRIYDPLLGRFLSADILVQNIGNLQAYNRYSYVMNNPLTLTDPSGFFWKELWAGIKEGFSQTATAQASASAQQLLVFRSDDSFRKTVEAQLQKNDELHSQLIENNTKSGIAEDDSTRKVGHFLGANAEPLVEILADGAKVGAGVYLDRRSNSSLRRSNPTSIITPAAGEGKLDNKDNTVFRGIAGKGEQRAAAAFQTGLQPHGGPDAKPTTENLIASINVSSKAANSAFVQASESREIATAFATNSGSRGGVVFEIAKTESAVVVNQSNLAGKIDYPEQKIVAFPGGVPAANIVRANVVDKSGAVIKVIENPNAKK